MNDQLHYTECPRDAMQGIKTFIPTDDKVRYINALLRVGFDVVDFGSFVSPKAVPQMRDTPEVLKRLNLDGTTSQLLAIVANERGARDAASYSEVGILGYPFSISETFQRRNTNAGIEESLHRVVEISNIATASAKTLVIYISMAFGNPYGDPYHPDLVARWIQRLNDETSVTSFSLADTVGVSDKANIEALFGTVIKEFGDFRIGAHLHSKPHEAAEKIMSAWNAGCRSLEGALLGLGGCPMADDELVGNIATEVVFQTLDETCYPHINTHQLNKAARLATEILTTSGH
ncbi:MAG: hydroxymethylglutaryl-CoA lyase [Salibacteraceae bacterium]